MKNDTSSHFVKTITIVSLSSGTIGEDFARHEVDIGIKRLQDMGIRVKFSENAMKGIDFIARHPEKRAGDLISAFNDDETDMILCAIGGDDTYRLLPYLFEHDELKNAIKNKIFLGFSDSTINHFMLRKAGLNTFYGQSFLADVCEIASDMLPYSKQFFTELITTGRINKITPSPVWYESRTNFDVDQIGTATPSHPDAGFELLQGKPTFCGKIFGGCIDSIYDVFNGDRYADMPVLCKKYGLFPSAEEWKNKILLLESSEEQMSPQKYEKALEYLKNAGVFAAISGIIVGKPQNEIFSAEYKDLLKRVVGNPDLPIVFNINAGHALPRCIIPFGVDAVADANKQIIQFKYD